MLRVSLGDVGWGGVTAAPSGVVRSALFPQICLSDVLPFLSDLQCLRALENLTDHHQRALLSCVSLGLRRYYIKPFLVREQKENRKGIKLFKDAFERKVKLMNDMK